MNSYRVATLVQACVVAAFIAVCVVTEPPGRATARLLRGYEKSDRFDKITPVRQRTVPCPEFIGNGLGVRYAVVLMQLYGLLHAAKKICGRCFSFGLICPFGWDAALIGS